MTTPPDEREGVIVGRIVIEKYATEEGIAVYFDGSDGSGNYDLPLVEALGMLTFAEHHIWDSVVYAEDDDD